MSKPEILQVGMVSPADQTALDTAYTCHAMYDDTGAPFTGAKRDTMLSEVGPRIRGIVTRGDLYADRGMIDACPILEIISVFGVGYDGVDVGHALSQGVTVTNTPDVLTDDVADIAIALMLALGRRVPAAEAWARSGDWGAKGAFPLTTRLSGKRAGVLGLGRIGRAIGQRAAAFNMPVAYSATSEKSDTPGWRFIADPVELAAECDVLFIALIANANTRHIVDAKVLDALGPDGMIVNISRAANIDEAAMLDALEAGAISGAGLDVFEGEPKVNPRFASLENVVMLPHVGSATTETRRAMGQLMRDNLAAQFSGTPVLTPVLS
jgi:lactate dehydrogenase-like 2-hydroxyacid dehydrogenase